MSITRYNFEVASQFKITDQIVYVEARPRKNGKYVRYSEYASLLASHNALVEAVKKEHLAFDALDDAGFQLGAVGMPIWTDHAAARAEVDRLIVNETKLIPYEECNAKESHAKREFDNSQL